MWSANRDWYPGSGSVSYSQFDKGIHELAIAAPYQKRYKHCYKTAFPTGLMLLKRRIS